jgi:hypothetical protein
LSRVPSRSPSPSTHVSRCQSFAERPQAQPLPLPLPGVPHTKIGRCDSGISASVKPGLDGGGKPLHLLPLPRPGHVLNRLDQADTAGDLATASVSSDSSIDSDDLPDSRVLSPFTSDYENGNRTAVNSPPRWASMCSIESFKVSFQVLSCLWQNLSLCLLKRDATGSIPYHK